MKRSCTLLSIVGLVLGGCGGGTTPPPTGPPPPQGPTGPPPSSENAMARLQALAQRVASGWQPVLEPVREGLAGEEVVVRELELTAGTCYVVLAAGEGAVRDIALRLMPPDSQDPIRVDQSVERDATLGIGRALCVETAGEYTLEIGMVDGAGGIAWGLFTRGESSAAPVSDDLRVGGEAGDFIASRIRRRHGEAGEGRPPTTDVMRIELGSGDEREMTFAAIGGHCYVVLAAGVPSAQVIQLAILDPHRNERDRAETEDGFPSARICSPVDGEWIVKLKMFRGYGEAGVQVFGSTDE